MTIFFFPIPVRALLCSGQPNTAARQRACGLSALGENQPGAEPAVRASPSSTITVLVSPGTGSRAPGSCKVCSWTCWQLGSSQAGQRTASGMQAKDAKVSALSDPLPWEKSWLTAAAGVFGKAAVFQQLL